MGAPRSSLWRSRAESGEARVERQGESEPLAKLTAGDFFGEMALLTDLPRTASVTCTAPSVLLALGREEFREVMVSDFSAGLRLEQVAEHRTMGPVAGGTSP